MSPLQLQRVRGTEDFAVAAGNAMNSKPSTSGVVVLAFAQNMHGAGRFCLRALETALMTPGCVGVGAEPAVDEGGRLAIVLGAARDAGQQQRSASAESDCVTARHSCTQSRPT